MMFPTFDEFYADVYQREAFPWQSALAHRVAERGWPAAVGVPTGLGKTSTIAVAVYELARQVHTGQPRSAPLRIFHVVDRRIIVDQVHRDIQTLAAAINSTPAHDPASPAAIVGDALVGRFGHALHIEKLHGQHLAGREWVVGDQPVLVTMTAHQCVSRVLFRGFGTSAGMSPVHAGLLGVDSLLLVDEPHLSVAAVQTLTEVKSAQARYRDLGIPVGQVVQVGATLAHDVDDIVAITDDDRAHPVAHRRLHAAKTLTTHPCPAASDTAVVQQMASLAREELTDPEVGTVAVIANTIGVARGVWEKLTGRGGAINEEDAALVTSRIRGFDRAGVDAALTGDRLPRLICATQTVEAGVDFSADALVTETCGWQALTQRLGRLNRYGDRHTARAHVVTTPRPRDGSAAVYGADPVTATSDVLLTATATGPINVAPEALAELEHTHADRVTTARGVAPDIPRLISDLFPTMTHSRPRPAADLDIKAFITGITDQTRDAADITVLWRDHLDPEVLARTPPTAAETVAIPARAVNDLLRARITGRPVKTPDLVSDATESASNDGTSIRWSKPDGEPIAMILSSDDTWTEVTQDDDVVGGSVIALASSIGGHDHTGWRPQSTEPVLDLSAHCALDTGAWWLADPSSLTALERARGINLPIDTAAMARLPETDPDNIADAFAAAVADPTGTLGELDFGEITDTGVWVRRRTPTPEAPTQRVTLDAHSAQVAAFAVRSARRVGLADDLAPTVEWAGYHHDLGKRHSAFQAMLGATPGGRILAKTAPQHEPNPSLVPRGWRHEAASAVAVLNQAGTDLLVHLIASHHGWARPLLPPAEGADQDLPGVVERFEQLNDIYGPWGLAYLEATVRLADHHASQTPEAGYEKPRSTMPTRHTDTQSMSSHEIRLSGIPAREPLEWWAAAGALAAAHDLDPAATLRFDPTPTGPVPILSTHLDLATISAQVATIQNQVKHLDKLLTVTAKNHKVPTTDAHTVLSELADLEPGVRTMATAVLPSTTWPDSNGKAPLQVPWHNWNNSLLKTVTAMPSDTLAERVHATLLADRADQYDGDSHHFGLSRSGLMSDLITGIQNPVRPGLLPLILTAAVRLPATGGDRAVGTTRTKTRWQPEPATPVTWPHLCALLQTIPALWRRRWSAIGVTAAEYETRATSDAKGKTWATTGRTTT